MKYSALIVVAVCALASVSPAGAVTCARGVYRAGCVGPNGAAVVRRPYATPYVARPPTYYRPPAATASCANGVYRAGCVGPNGAAVVRKPY